MILCLLCFFIKGKQKSTVELQLVNSFFLSDYVYIFYDNKEREHIVSTSGLGIATKYSEFFKSILNLIIYVKYILNGQNKENINCLFESLEKAYTRKENEGILNEKYFYVIYVLCYFLKYLNSEEIDSKVINNTKIGNDMQDLLVAIIKNVDTYYIDGIERKFNEFYQQIMLHSVERKKLSKKGKKKK